MSAPPAAMPNTASASALPAPVRWCSIKLHTPNPNANSVETRMKKTWKALSDIDSILRVPVRCLRLRALAEVPGVRVQRERGQEQHQDEEGGRERQDRVDDLLLRDEVHEEGSHQRGLHGGDDERERDR